MSTAAERLAVTVTDGEQSTSITDRLLTAILVQFIELTDAMKRREARRLAERDAAQSNAAPRSAPASSAPSSNGGLVFPNYGKSKGQSVSGATVQDLEYYAGGCRRTLGDPNKQRWHDKERVLLAAIEAEIIRQRGGASSQPSFSDSPPPDFGSPGGDDDIPF